MSDLAQTYAMEQGVQLEKPDIVDTFYPLDHPLDRAILIHAFAGATVQHGNQIVATFSAKIYDRFNEMIALLKPVAEAAGFKLYQIGGPGEPPLRGVDSLVGKTTMHQCAHLVKGAALLIGNDSIWAHVRGAYDGAQVHIYGSTSKPHFPHWRTDKSILIESHRGGKKPTYAAQEHPKTINLIPPEQIANAACDLVLQKSPAGGFQLSRQSLFFGDAYHAGAVELVPNVIVAPQLQINGPLTIRMDYVAETPEAWAAAEGFLVSNLQLRKCQIITDREINPNLLVQLKGNVVALRVEVDRVSADWLKVVRRLGLNVAFFSSERDAEKLRLRRLDLYDACGLLFDHYVPPTREDFVKAVGTYLNRTVEAAALPMDKLSFTTGKFLLSEDKIYLSKAHWRAGKPTPNTDQNTAAVIDDAAFWEEQAHFYVHTETPLPAATS